MSYRRRIVLVDGDVLWRCVRLICRTWAFTAMVSQPTLVNGLWIHARRDDAAAFIKEADHEA